MTFLRQIDPEKSEKDSKIVLRGALGGGVQGGLEESYPEQGRRNLS
jgi:hypothetical protein